MLPGTVSGYTNPGEKESESKWGDDSMTGLKGLVVGPCVGNLVPENGSIKRTDQEIDVPIEDETEV